MIWELCAKFTRWFFLTFFMAEITWSCRICGGIFPIDDEYIKYTTSENKNVINLKFTFLTGSKIPEEIEVMYFKE